MIAALGVALLVATGWVGVASDQTAPDAGVGSLQRDDVGNADDGLRRDPPARAPRGGTTALRVTTADADRTWTADDLRGSGGENYAVFGAGSVADGFEFSVRAARGEVLVPGTYAAVAERYQYTAPARLEVPPLGSCGPTGGTYTIHEAEYDRRGRMLRFSMTFEQACDGASEVGMRGTLAWQAADGLPDIEPVEPWRKPAPGLQVHPAVGAARLSYLRLPELGAATDNPSDVVVRMAAGTVAPATPTSGQALQPTRGVGGFGHDRVDISGLLEGRSYAVRFFDVSLYADTATPQTVVLHGTRTAVSMRHDRRGARPTLVRGRLVRTSGPAAAAGRTVVLDVKLRAGGWTSVAVRTGPDGRFSARVPRAARVDALFAGNGNDLGSAATVGARRTS